MNIYVSRILNICFYAAFDLIMVDKVSAEQSNWSNASNKHFSISKIIINHIFKGKQFIKSSFSIFEEKKLIENQSWNIQFPSKYATRLYILFCELKFA